MLAPIEWKAPPIGGAPGLFPLQRVLDATDGILHFPCNLISLSFTFEFAVTGDLQADEPQEHCVR